MRTVTSILLLLILTASLLVAGDGLSCVYKFRPAAMQGRTTLMDTVHKADFLVTTTPTVTNVKRFGVNLGNWTYWGAEQLMSNVLKNPGFEGVLDRAIVIVKRADQQGFTDDTTWLGRPDDFWAGAEYDVRSGLSAGAHGKISSSRRSGTNGLPEFKTQGDAPALQPGDVVALTRVQDSLLPTQWWFSPSNTGTIATVNQDRRPGSTGVRSLALRPRGSNPPVEVISYLDTIGKRAGRLLPVNGTWRLVFWTRGCGGQPTLTVEFRRAGSPAFLQKTLTPAADWTKVTFDFTATDSNSNEALELHFKASGANTCVLLDDVELGALKDQGSPFRSEVVSALRELRPGYLRDWQGQLGDTFENRIASPFARRASRYRPGEGTDYGYSLPEFLDLCATVDAVPWIVIPTTFSDEDCRALGQYLADPKLHLKEAVLEFGNENWNAIFRPAGIPNPVAHGEAANRAFKLISETIGKKINVRKVVNGQSANPEYALRFAQYATEADTLALAPYFQYSLTAGTPSTDWLKQLFTADQKPVQDVASALAAKNKTLSVYEVNLHTTEGNAPASERDPLTAGAAAGSALAKVMLETLALGAREQCVYTFSGYDTWLSGAASFGKLWGITRDVTDTVHWRPSGLMLTALNKAIAGNLVESRKLSGLAAEVYAFQNQNQWTAAVISTNPHEQNVNINFPTEVESQLPLQLVRLEAAAPWSTNESATEVSLYQETLTPNGNCVSFRLPAYGFAVLIQKEKRNGR